MKKRFLMGMLLLAGSVSAKELLNLNINDTIADRKSIPTLVEGSALVKSDADGRKFIEMRGKNFRSLRFKQEKILNPAGGKIKFSFRPYFTVKKPGWTVASILSLYGTKTAPDAGLHITTTHHKGKYFFNIGARDWYGKRVVRGIEYTLEANRWYQAEISWDYSGVTVKLDDQTVKLKAAMPLKFGDNPIFSLGSPVPDVDISDLVISDKNL